VLADWVYVVVTIVAVALLALAFRSNVDWLLLRALFTTTQVSFVAVMYLFLNYSTWFIDLTIPFTAAFAYFVVAGFYAQAVTLRRNGHAWFSTALDPGRTAQVLLLACRINAPPRQRSRIHGILQRRSGLTRFGAAAPRLFGAAPLLERLYEDMALFYWLVPPERTCAALTDLFTMLERSLDAVERRADGGALQFALHAACFTVDERGEWQSQGKQAFMIELLLTQEPQQAPLVRSEEFAAVCTACNVDVPQPLARAGIDERSPRVETHS
jgi:hypothetical protein